MEKKKKNKLHFTICIHHGKSLNSQLLICASERLRCIRFSSPPSGISSIAATWLVLIHTSLWKICLMLHRIIPLFSDSWPARSSKFLSFLSSIILLLSTKVGLYPSSYLPLFLASSTEDRGP